MATRYIPFEKMKQLREAARNGDERAKKIIRAQLDGSDFAADLDAYFAPAPVEATNEEVAESEESVAETGLDRFLSDNEITKDSPEYEDFVNDYYLEHPEEHRNEPVSGFIPAEEAPDTEEEVDLTKDIAEKLIEVISCCDQTMVLVLNNDDIEDTTQKGIMTTLQEIKQSILDSFDKIKKVKKSLCEKKEEEGNGGL